MRGGLVLAMVLSPVVIDESIAPARDSQGPPSVRSRQADGLDPIDPGIFIPPVGPPPEPRPARPPASTLHSLGIIPVRLDLPVNNPSAR